MSIEDVAHNTPEKIFKLQVDINKGLDVEALLKAAVNLGLDEYKSQVVFLFKHLYDLFIERDADLIEINPLTLLKDGSMYCHDVYWWEYRFHGASGWSWQACGEAVFSLPRGWKIEGSASLLLSLPACLGARCWW